VGLAVAVLLALVAGCAKGHLEGQSNAVPVLSQLVGAAGVRPTDFAGYLASDVLTYVRKNINNQQVCVPTLYEDSGRAVFHLALKDPGSVDFPTTPSPANTITFTRYRVDYVRADGRNVPGVDVPYGFDGAMQLAVVGPNVSIGQLILVRVQAKEEPPLKALVAGGGAGTIATLAEVTFYGTDQSGRTVSVKGHISVNFSDWADPDC
jgi:hypothetical protein